MDTGTIWLAAGVVATLLGVFLERLAEESDENTPIIGPYRGLIRAVARALIPKRWRRPDPSPRKPGGPDIGV